ncbi:D-alanyl-D-alanine carboxypeptidase family protein [Sanguibacter sp. 25GB23B1]|uniref:D-alanyl-D-alanine carboxypeptidase family protein n=1 Tax=unclassified Sanguibacter TaxID=2645534 RepID=UPI0032AF3744
MTSAAPTSPDSRSDDIVSAVRAAPATVWRTAEVTTARLTTQAHGWTLRERTEALAVAGSAVQVGDRAAEAVTSAAMEPGSVAEVGTAYTGSPGGASLETTAVDVQALSAARTHLSGLVTQATAGWGQPTGWARVAGPDEIARAVVAARRFSHELLDVAADVSVLALRVEQSLVSEPEPQGVPADESALRLQRSAATADAWPNGAIPLGVLCSPDAAPGIFLRCDAAEALDRLARAYRAANGRELRVYSGYRSYERQAAIKQQHGGLAAAPGRSNHGRGIAIDLYDMGGLGQFDAPGYLWMKAHAPAFGWYHPPMMEPGGRGPKEPWHWEFGTWSGYDDGGSTGAPPEPGSGLPPWIRSDRPVAGPTVEQPSPAETSGPPRPVVPSIPPSAEPPTPPAAPAPPGPSTPPAEAPPPTEQDPPQEPPPDGENPPSEETPPSEENPPAEENPPTEENPPSEENPPIGECPLADEDVPAEDGADAEVPARESESLEADAPVGSASPDGSPPAEVPPARAGLPGSEGPPSGAQTPSTDGTGPIPPAEAGACEVERS